MLENSLLLISHVGDEDGLFPVILAKLVYKHVTTLLINPDEVDENLQKNLDRYDLIHITDLNISNDMAQIINKNEKYKNKIKIFDHHISKIDLNQYDFITVIDEQNGKKQSATSIYYDYLTKISKNTLLHKQVTKELVNQVRIIDTYDFKTKKDEEAKNLDYIFSILGRTTFIEYFTKYIKENKAFKYRKQEKFLIKLQKDKTDNYIKQKESELIKAKLDGYHVGIIYAESYRGLLGNTVLEKHQELDFVIIINISKSISYRGKDKIDLSLFSKKYNGGGHKNSAGSPLPENLLNNITKLIYNNIEEETK